MEQVFSGKSVTADHFLSMDAVSTNVSCPTKIPRQDPPSYGRVENRTSKASGKTSQDRIETERSPRECRSFKLDSMFQMGIFQVVPVLGKRPPLNHVGCDVQQVSPQPDEL